MTFTASTNWAPCHLFKVNVTMPACRLSCSSATSLSSPMRWRQRVNEERSNGKQWQKNASPQSSLVRGVLQPALGQRLVGKAVHVLDDGQAGRRAVTLQDIV